jgi:HK97 family phage portal protein
VGVLDRLRRADRAVRADAAPVQRRWSQQITVQNGRLSTPGTVHTDPAASATVYRCVQTVATNLASLDLAVRDADGEARPDHPISLLFNRRPNPTYSARLLKEIVWSQLELRGKSFLYLDRGEAGDGEAAAVWPIFDEVDVVIDDTEQTAAQRAAGAGVIKGFIVRRGAQRVGLLPSELLWLRYPHPTVPWASQSPLQAAQFASDLDTYAKHWQKGELQNGPGANGIVFLGDLEEDQFTSTVAALRQEIDGPRNSRRNAFTSGTVKPEFVRLGLTAVEASYIDSRKVNREEIALAFGVPRDLLFGESTFDNQRAAKVNLWSDTLVPKGEVVAGEIDRQLLPDLAETAEWDTSQVEALRENQDAIALRVNSATDRDLLLLDEAREQMGLDPLPGGAGQLTLTAYRLSLEAGPAEPAPTPAARAAAVALETRAVRTVAVDPSQILRQYAAMEAIGRKAVKRLAARQKQAVMRRLEQLERKAAPDWQVRTQPEDLFDERFWVEQTEDILGGFFGQVFDGGAAQTAKALGLDFDLFDTQVTLAMQARLDTLADVVTATTKRAIADALLEPGVEAGESVPNLAARLTAVFDDLSTTRAETIARTETVGGHNAASRTAASASGLVTARQWLAASDARVRDSHVELDGHTTNGMDDPYPNGLMYPGDPSGPARESINCRCVETYVLLDEDEQ